MAKNIMTSGIEMSDVIKTTGFPVPEDLEGKTFAECVSGGGGGSGDITVEALTATENKVYTAPEGKAYSPVTVNVPKTLWKFSYTLDATAVDSIIFKEEPQVGVPITGYFSVRTSYDSEECTELLSGSFTFSNVDNNPYVLSSKPAQYPYNTLYFRETI